MLCAPGHARSLRRCVLCALAGLLPGPALLAQDEAATPPIIKYRTREEKREAGLTRQLTPWLSVAGVLESEAERETLHFGDGGKRRRDVVDATLQVDVEFALGEALESELVLEYGNDHSQPLVDEFLLGWDFADGWGLTLGRYYLPFGLYYSNFINGPLLEFSETRADVVQLDYDFDDRLETALFLYQGKARPLEGRALGDNWGASFEARLFNAHLLLGGGYLSNLADADFGPLDDAGGRYRKPVPAWNLSAVGEWGSLGFSLELIRARGGFPELEPDEASPRAWNAELAWYPSRSLELAWRHEKASGLGEDSGVRRGLQLTWRPARRFSLSLEYLRQDFSAALARDGEEEDEEGEPARRRGFFGAASVSWIF